MGWNREGSRGLEDGGEWRERQGSIA